MTAVLDIGNARLKWAMTEGESLLTASSESHIESWDNAVQSFIDAHPDGVDRVVATNVAVDALARLVEATVEKHWDVTVEWLATAKTQLGVTCAYAEPERMGVDRWVAVLAAHVIAEGPVCVIDAGTAVTFDAVDKGGRHLGGLIMAGPRLAASSLDCRTPGIGFTNRVPEPISRLDILASDTDSAVANGTMLALSSALQKAITIVADELDAMPLILLCGGDSPALLPWLDAKVEYRKDLVLEGIALVAADS